jgi:hypothetical protein
MACGLRRVDVRRFHLTRPLATVVGPVTLLHATLPMSRRLAPQVLVDLLTHPYCVREARRVVLDALELTYDRPFADLWEFVAFAEVGHPELDLLSPPKRAVVKLP